MARTLEDIFNDDAVIKPALLVNTNDEYFILAAPLINGNNIWYTGQSLVKTPEQIGFRSVSMQAYYRGSEAIWDVISN